MNRILMAFALLATALSAHAHSVHQHGVAEASVVLEDKELAITFRAPLMDILGTETAPATEHERQRYNKGLERVSNPQLPESAQCRLASVQRSTADTLFPHAGHHHSHNPNHDHDHHADFEARWTFECQQPDALKQIRLPWLQDFKNLQTDVVLLLPAGQTAVRLTQGQTRIALEQ